MTFENYLKKAKDYQDSYWTVVRGYCLICIEFLKLSLINKDQQEIYFLDNKEDPSDYHIKVKIWQDQEFK